MSLTRLGLKSVLALAATISFAAPALSQGSSPPVVTITCPNFTLATTVAGFQCPPGQLYSLTDLGVISVVDGNSSGDTDSYATAINKSGTVVGFSGIYDPASFGFVTQH